MTRKELTEKYRKDLAEGKPVHGEARDMVIDADIDERKDEAVIKYQRLRLYLNDMDFFAHNLTADNKDFIAGYRLALRQTIEFITEMKE